MNTASEVFCVDNERCRESHMTSKLKQLSGTIFLVNELCMRYYMPSNFAVDCLFDSQNLCLMQLPFLNLVLCLLNRDAEESNRSKTKEEDRKRSCRGEEEKA